MVVKKISFLKNILVGLTQSLFATVLLFFILEGIFFALGFPRGASSYVESIVIREGLKARKPGNEFRIFAYGESTMQGSHYGDFSSPAQWLEVYLKDFLPQRNIKVVNFSRIGHGIFYSYQFLIQTRDYHPDLVLFYSGHNLFLPGNRKDQVEAKIKKSSTFWRGLMQQSRFLSFVYRLSIKIKLARHQGKDPDADRIEHPVIEVGPTGMGSENAVPNNTSAYGENIAFFRENLLKILNHLEKKKIQALFLMPVGNLKDFAPFMPLHMKPLGEDDLKRWEALVESGRNALKQGHAQDAIVFWSQAHEIDPTYAELDFNLGRLCFESGDLEKAKSLFKEARDYDAIKVRAPKEVLQIFRALADEGRIHLVDTEKVLSPEAPGGILGEPIIEDNVHFSIRGHSLVGKALAEEIARQGWIAPFAEWRFDRSRSYEEIYQQLGISKELLFAADLKLVHFFGRRYDNRIRFAKDALEISPDSPRALRHLAWSYWLKGDQKEAMEVYRKLEGIHPEALKEVFNLQPEVQKVFKKSFSSSAVQEARKAA